jgi:hypothetical protein
VVYLLLFLRYIYIFVDLICETGKNEFDHEQNNKKPEVKKKSILKTMWNSLWKTGEVKSKSSLSSSQKV